MSGVLQERNLEDELAQLEQDMANARSKHELSTRIDSLTPAVASHPLLLLRLLIMRGAVENRLTLSGKALATLYEARKLAAMQGAEPYRARLSREIATVHAWRGKGEPAMRELLRAIAEAKSAGQPEEEAGAIADAVRACKEIKDYELALVFLDAALTLPATPLMRARSFLDRLQILNRDGRHAACLIESDASMAAIEAVDSTRVKLLARIERARAFAGVGRTDEAREVLESARAMLSDDPGAYERIEWTEASHEIAKMVELESGQSAEQADAARRALEGMIDKFHADALHGQEADKRLELAELHYRHQRTDEALRQASAAVAIGAQHGLPGVVERGKNALLVFCNSYDNSASGLVENRYVVGDSLGSGGFGEVKRAYDVATGARRAIKFISMRGISDGKLRDRLLADARAEIDAAKRAVHPGIVRVHSIFVDGDTIVVVQDLVEGHTLETLRGEPMKLRTVVSMFRDIADALVVLHQANVIHRDLKPANVIVNDVMQPTVVDFGLAAIAGAAEDDSPLRGTRNYVAPELLTFETRPAPHARQDVFALGVMLAEFLPPDARPLPFGLGTLFGMGTSLTRLVSDMRSRDPDRRPQDMRTVADTLNRVAIELGAQSSER